MDNAGSVSGIAAHDPGSRSDRERAAHPVRDPAADSGGFEAAGTGRSRSGGVRSGGTFASMATPRSGDGPALRRPAENGFPGRAAGVFARGDFRDDLGAGVWI